MSVHIIIDGYNLIRQSARLSRIEGRDLQEGREALVEALAAYRKLKRHPITVVFDGTAAPCFSQRRDRWKGIEIRFSACGELADALIRRMAARERDRALVVSSDRAVAEAAAGYGATVVASSDFEQRLEMALVMGGDVEGDDAADGWTPTTRKKGPSRRLPKRQRRQRSRLEKL